MVDGLLVIDVDRDTLVRRRVDACTLLSIWHRRDQLGREVRWLRDARDLLYSVGHARWSAMGRRRSVCGYCETLAQCSIGTMPQCHLEVAVKCVQDGPEELPDYSTLVVEREGLELAG